MPLYAYKCNNCDYRFDVRQRFSDDPLTECPRCGEQQVRRVISQVGIVFKGSGFYVTDNRNGKANGAVTGAARSEPEKKSASDEKKEVSKTEHVPVSKSASDNAPASAA